MSFPVFSLIALSAACSRTPTEATPAQLAVQPAASAKAPSYSARGVVRKLETEKQTLWIAHEDIPGYMKAMTMPFRASAALLAELHTGDSIEFSFHDDGDGNLIIETLRKAK